jgi:hypothetical protein
MPATSVDQMAGSPLKRQRKLGVCDEDASVIAFPRFTHRAGLSNAQWRALSPAEKVERQLNIPLDRVAEILSWPVAELDPLRFSLWMQVWRVVFMIGAKALLDGKLGREAERERDRDRVLRELARGLRQANSGP